MSSVSDEVLEITINNSETPSKTPSGKADSRGGEGERGGEEKGGEGGREERKEGEEGRCEENLPEEAKAVDTNEHSEEQTKRTMTDDNEQVLNCSTGGREGEREVAERKREEDESQFMRVGYDHQSNVEHEEPAHGTGTAAAGHEGDTGTKTKSPIHLSNKLMFALD